MNHSSKLRLVLRANAIFSTVAGIVAVVSAGWLSRSSGIDHVALTRLGGVALIIFGIAVFSVTVFGVTRRPDNKLAADTLEIIIADFAWVAATIVVLNMVEFTRGGAIGAIVIAVVVGGFGATQAWLRAKLLAQASPAIVTA